MPTGISQETIFSGPRRRFQQLNEKPLRDDLVFYFAIVAAVSVLFMALPLLTGEAVDIDGMHRIWFIAAGTLITLMQGLINGSVALLAVSLVEHFFLLFVDVHREFEKTMKSTVYALSPLILFSWAVLLGVPFAGLLLLVWFCLLTYFGVRVFHEKSKDRAVFVALATGVVLAYYLHRAVGIV
ncbi:YIP1 family protein [Methanoculleus sp. Wushi-C6]|uniref:YIP1 family protein n=1 Tax=Methanoculleus caldifontis TaxID=2651577 RepID=A0ABU3WYX7_9EURY|nr:YIP1 family protein [Methanoculleus sp. Wushi-C6]MDV2481003.1 YIP1 family protein [Methanoculleus sp. Wushi-C6]